MNIQRLLVLGVFLLMITNILLLSLYRETKLISNQTKQVDNPSKEVDAYLPLNNILQKNVILTQQSDSPLATTYYTSSRPTSVGESTKGTEIEQAQGSLDIPSSEISPVVKNEFSDTFRETMSRYLQKERETADTSYFHWETVSGITVAQYFNTRMQQKPNENLQNIFQIFPRQLLSNIELSEEEYFSIFSSPVVDRNTYVCIRTETICIIYSQTLQNSGMVDITVLYNLLFRTYDMADVPLSVAMWCIFVAHTDTPQKCFLSAIGRPKSIFGRLRFIEFQSLRIFLQVTSISRYDWELVASDILLMDELMPHEWVADKASFFISLIQQSDEEKQRKIHHYCPRTYYVSTPCDRVEKLDTFDQWNLWLDDFYNGEPPTELLLSTKHENMHFKGDSLTWTQKQESIDLGANLWISKPSILTLSTKESPRQASPDERIHTHEGNAIQVVRNPSTLKDITKIDNEKYGKCVGNHRLIQKYVEQPLLMDGRKTDIRIYILVASLDPLEVYFHTTIIPVRQARQLYNESHNDDRAHVTNLSKALREEQDDIHRYWSEYRAALARQLAITESEIETIIFERVKGLMHAVFDLIPSSTHLNNAAALMGWDIILDRNMSPWLMETNLRPDMRTSISEISLLNPQLQHSALEILMMKSLNMPIPSKFLDWQKL